MVLVPDTILRSLAARGDPRRRSSPSSAALTLLPAVLSLLGDRVERAAASPALGRSTRRRGPLLVGRRAPRHAPAAARAWCRGVLVPAAAGGARARAEERLRRPAHAARRLPVQAGLRRAGGVVRRRHRRHSLEVVVDGDVRRRRRARGRPSGSASASRGDRALPQHDASSTTRRSVSAIVEASAGRRLERRPRRRGRARPARASRSPRRSGDADVRVLVTGETAENVDYFALDRALAADRLRLRPWASASCS